MVNRVRNTVLILDFINFMSLFEGKKVIIYGQEPPSEEYTTSECGVNYQLLATITEVAR